MIEKENCALLDDSVCRLPSEFTFPTPQNSHLRESDTGGLPWRSLRWERRGQNATGSGFHANGRVAEPHGPRTTRTFSHLRSEILSAPIPRSSQTTLLGRHLSSFHLLLSARPSTPLSVRILSVHRRHGHHGLQQERPTNHRSSLPARNVFPTLRRIDLEPRREIHRSASYDRQGFPCERCQIERGRTDAFVDRKTNEIESEFRREFSPELHRKGGRLQNGEQQMGESEHGDVVITKGQGMTIVNIRPATFQHVLYIGACMRLARRRRVRFAFRTTDRSFRRKTRFPTQRICDAFLRMIHFAGVESEITCKYTFSFVSNFISIITIVVSRVLIKHILYNTCVYMYIYLIVDA